MSPARARPRITPRLALALASALCGCEAAGPPPPRPHAALEDDLEEELRAGGMPGLAAALVEGDEVAWVGTFGYADLAARRPVTRDTAFLVASISKTVVSFLAAQLAEDGALDLDAAIDGPLGYPVAHPGPADRRLTPRALATHTSGLSDDWAVLGGATTDGDSRVPLADFAREYLARTDHFARAPGTRRVYSNAGFGVLGAVVEAAAGEPLPALSKRTVFEPIGMHATGWHLADLDPSRLATPYSGTWAEGFVPSAQQGYAFYPATSLRTTVDDLARFLITFMRYGETPDGTRVLAEATARAMRAPQVPELDPDQGLVWYYDSIGGERWLGHTGSAVGASAMMFFRPEAGPDAPSAARRGVILLTNADLYIRDRLGLPEGAQAFRRMAARIAAEPL